MSSLVVTLTETLRYRGAVGQWSWVLHRLTGLGVVFFLTLHVIDTSWSVFYPALYEKAIAVYQSPLFTLGEFALVAAVVYHAFNGLRIAIFDARPELWKHQQRAVIMVLLLSIVTLIPTFILMFNHVVKHYSPENEHLFVLPLNEVLVEQLPFLVGMVVAVIAAIIFSGLSGLVIGSGKTRSEARKPQGSRLERFWWSFMRVSGLLIVPLVFGHLALVHVLQGVFDITLAQMNVVGTNGINHTGTAVEFVAERWNYLMAGVAVWRIYDIGLLALVTVHGFNGLRYVLTDYTSNSPLLRRAMAYLCLIGGVTLLVVGGLALVSSISDTAVEAAATSYCELREISEEECEPLEVFNDNGGLVIDALK